jgi:hypothetical protein
MIKKYETSHYDNEKSKKSRLGSAKVFFDGNKKWGEIRLLCSEPLCPLTSLRQSSGEPSGAGLVQETPQ